MDAARADLDAARFRDLADAAPFGLLYLDAGGAVTYVNERWREITGLGGAESLRPEAARILHPDDRERVVREIGGALREGRSITLEYRIRREDGTTRWVSGRATRVQTNGNGDGAGVVASITDITAEMEVRRGREWLAQILAASPDYAVITDSEGRTLFMNDASRALYGLAPEADLDDFRWEHHLPAWARELTAKEISPALLDGGVWVGESALVSGDGREVPVSVVTVATDAPDRDGAWFATIARDISSLKAIEQQLASSEARFRSMLHFAADLIDVRGADGSVRYLSPSVTDVLGYTHEELSTVPPLSLVHPDDRALFAVARDRLADRPGGWESVKYRFRHRDGTWRWLESRITNGLDDPDVRGIVTCSWDETDRQLALARGAESEEALQAIVASSPIGIFAVTADGTVRIWNRACERIFGWAADEVVGGRLPFTTSPDPDHKVRLRRRYAAGESLESREVQVHRKDGSRVYITIATAPIRGHDGRVSTVVGVIADSTDRHEASDALRASEERFRSLVQHSSDFVMVWDEHNRITYLSPSTGRFFGTAVKVGDPAYRPSLLHPDDTERVVDFFRQLYSAGRVSRRIEYRLRALDGAFHWLESTATNLLDDPSVLGVVLNSRDVTERVEAAHAMREMNDALRRSNDTLSAIYENAPLAIYAFDADGKILFWNPAAEQTYGWTAVEAVGRFSLPVREVDVEPCRELRDRVMAGELVEAAEARRVTKDRGEIDVLFSAAPLRDGNGDIIGVLALSADITGQKRAEGALRASEERFRALVQHASDVIAVLDCDGILTYASPSVEPMLGYSADSILGTSALELVHPDDYERAAYSLSVTNDELDDDHVELRVRTAGGEWRHVEIIGTNHVDDPAVEGTVLNIRDVTERRRSDQARRASEQRYRAIVEDQTEFVCRWELDGTLTFVNEAYARYFGRTVDEFVGSNWVDGLDPTDRAKAVAMLASLTAERPVVTVEYAMRMRDGQLHWQQWTNRVVVDEHGRPVEYQAVGRDITEKRAAESLVQEQARVLELIAQGAELPEILTEVCLVVESHMPEGICSVLLLDEESSKLRTAAAPHLPDTVLDAIAEGVPLGPRSGVCGAAGFHRRRVATPDIASDPEWEPYRELALSHGLRAAWSTPIVSSTDERLLGTFAVYYESPREPLPEHLRLVDLMVHVTTIAIERKAYESRLAYQAHHDPLTGLPNRMLFLEFLVLALARSRRFHSRVAVLFLDLDRFKFVNDSLGHDVGDELLVALGDRLRTAVRPGDTVARFGGDEFVVLCEDLSGPDARKQAIDVADRLLDVIAEPFLLDGDEHYLSASIGIALARGGDERPEALLRDADSAMYRAKERGKGRWELFDDAMRASALQRVEIENALHRAIDRAEFRVVYQPIVALADGHCIGAEALVRWQHPERGLLTPDEFVDLAEESGLIVPLGIWVLDEACRQAAEWEAVGGGEFVVSVNLSGRQLAHPDTPHHVARALAASGIDPARLALEITESVLMDDADATMAAIGALKDLGVGLSIDDFGTGYSSLGYLQRFPVDCVKIDRSFVAGLGDKQEDGAIVAAVVSLGHALGLTVVAEGVETARQREQLLALQCDAAQGYLYSPPRAAADLDGLRPGDLVRA